VAWQDRQYNDQYQFGFLSIGDEVISGMPPFDPKQRSNGDLTLIDFNNKY
jgi:hypothetical protein